MSRGGTKRSHAEQERRRRKRERATNAEATKKAKAAPKPNQGRGKAVGLHLMSLLAPFLMAAGLGLSGEWLTSDEDTEVGGIFGFIQAPIDGYVDLAERLDLSGDPYWEDPIGLLFMLLVWTLAAAVFWVLMVVGWRRIYRKVQFLDRDWSSIDQSFTLVIAVAAAWLVRGLFGFGPAVESLMSFSLLLSVYIPLFSAGLALMLPIVPGSGRIGGVLPTFLKIPFTERVLMTDEQKEEAALAQVTIKAATEASREADQAEREAKRAAKRAAKKK